MSLTKCKECGNQVSSKAATCPICGVVLRHKLGCIGKLLVILIVGYLAIDFMRYINGSGSSTNSVPRVESRTTSLPSTAPTTEAQQVEHVFQEGDNVCMDEFCFTVWKSWWSDSLGNEPLMHSKKPDAMYLFIDMTVQNNDHEPRLVRNFKLVDQNGSSYEVNDNSWLVNGAMGIYEEINPSVSKRGIYVYDLPQDRQYHLKLISNMFRSNAAYVRLDPNGIKRGSEMATSIDTGKDTSQALPGRSSPE